MRFILPGSNGQAPSEFPAKPEGTSPSLEIQSAGPISIFLPLPWLKAEPALLAAWAILLKGYYGHNPISFLRFGRKKTNVFPGQTGEPESVSVELHLEHNAVDLQENLLQSINTSAPSSPVITDGSKHYAVCLADEEDSLADEDKQNISHLEHASEVCLFLVAKRIKQDNVIVNLHSPLERSCRFKLSSLLDSFRKILDSLLYHPFKMIKDIEIISNYDRLSLSRWMETNSPRPATTIHSLVNRHYRERPQHIAISSTSTEVTYEELGKLSAAAGQKLREHGVGPGHIIGLCIEKSAYSLILLLAILRAGAGYVPIATSIPVHRIEYIIQKAECRFLLVESGILEELKTHDSFQDVKMITPSQLSDLEDPSDTWDQELDLDSSQVAYIMFTSGSTGNPKGVVHQHGTVSGGLEAIAEDFQLNDSTRFLQFASFSFDASICELFVPLIIGGTVCIPSEEERIEELEGVIDRLKVTDASLTPAIVTSLIPENVPSLRHLYIGGEAPTAAILSTWADKVRLSNIYGLTEGGVWDTVKLNMRSYDNPKDIGRGIGARCWIVDPDNIHNLQPIGVEGEILLQSPYLAHASLDDKNGQMSNAFVPLPESYSTLAKESTARCYRTGDLARWEPDGSMIFVGRRAGFVKLRGLRVELGEIEKAICESLMEGQQAAVILSRGEGENNSPELVAFVEQKSGLSSSLANKMSAKLQTVLPSYMVPSAFVPVDSLPLTDSKKIHRQQLITDWANMTPSKAMIFRPGGTCSQTWARISTANSRAIELSNLIADLVETKQSSAGRSLRGWDFPLGSVGLDSIQTAYLSRDICRRWGVATQIRELLHPGITVCQIEQQISAREKGGSDGLSGISTPSNLSEELDLIEFSVPLHTESTKTIFATTITGFLGSQILRVLLEDPSVDRIVGLVRSNSEEEARDKIRSHAQLGRWWCPEFDSQIEVWLGDLSLPKLGLDDTHWASLTGQMHIDGIIHNGARVNWLDDFSTLKATNVDSTRTLLEALSSRSFPCPFTYVCGGYLPLPTETRGQVLDSLAYACGYDQTKFLSRMMVEKYNCQLDQHSTPSVPRARVIQPGFIAGTRWEGIAHSEDFLWRLAYSILSLGTVSCDLQKSHIPVAGVEQIASLVVDSVLNPQGEDTVECHDGVSIGTLCEILSSHSGQSINPVSHTEWITALRDNVERSALDHPFLPVLDWFEANMGQFTGPPPLKRRAAFNQRDTLAALDKSTRYLGEIGFLPVVNYNRQSVDHRHIPRFSRSNR